MQPNNCQCAACRKVWGMAPIGDGNEMPECPICGGDGKVPLLEFEGEEIKSVDVACPSCGGKGRVEG